MVASSRPKPIRSPQAARTAGATCTTVITSLFSIASQTFSVSSRARNADVGQWVIHCPQREQSASSILRPPETLIDVREPVPTRSHICRLWILSQIWMQRIHLIHLLESRINGKSLFHGIRSISVWKGTSIILKSLAIFCKEQFA